MTINVDNDIAIAAISRVTNPITANGTATALYANARPIFICNTSRHDRNLQTTSTASGRNSSLKRESTGPAPSYVSHSVDVVSDDKGACTSHNTAKSDRTSSSSITARSPNSGVSSTSRAAGTMPAVGFVGSVTFLCLRSTGLVNM